MPTFSQALRRIIVGDPFGEVQPPRPRPDPLAEDARTSALKVLRFYLSELTFLRKGAAGGPPIRFSVPERDILIEWPDHEREFRLPAIAVVPAEGNYDVLGLGTYVDESTRDVYRKGTVLARVAEYREEFTLQVWASTKAERRALCSGLEDQLTVTEQASGLRLRVDAYYRQVACFAWLSRTIVDGEESARGRRLANVKVELRITLVRLVNYEPLTPQVQTIVGETVVVDPGVDDELVDVEAE